MGTARGRRALGRRWPKLEEALSADREWSGTDVTVGQVESALSALRRKERGAAVRASVLTLVIVVEDRAEADAALTVVHDLGARHPSRTIVLIVGPHQVRGPGGVPAPSRRGGPSGRDAIVRVHALEANDRKVFFEEVEITIRGQGRHHLNSIVGPLALPDVRMVVWLPSRLPAPGDPLMALTDRVVVDSRAVAEHHGDVLARSAVLAHQLPVTDLSWMRMTPWRTLLASLFEGGVTRSFLDGVTKVEVAGNFGPRHLLGGWLLARLGLPVERIHLRAAEHVSIDIHATVGDRQGRFLVRRPTAEREILASVEVEDGPSWEQVVRMREQWAALALADSLTQVGRDRGFEEALAGARRLRATAAA